MKEAVWEREKGLKEMKTVINETEKKVEEMQEVVKEQAEAKNQADYNSLGIVNKLKKVKDKYKKKVEELN